MKALALAQGSKAEFLVVCEQLMNEQDMSCEENRYELFVFLVIYERA
jgi:hypothetical protein